MGGGPTPCHPGARMPTPASVQTWVPSVLTVIEPMVDVASHGGLIHYLADGSAVVTFAQGSDPASAAARCALALREQRPDTPLAIATGLAEMDGPAPVGEVIERAAAALARASCGETRLDREGLHWILPTGTDQELAELRASYEHLTQLRDEVIEMGLLPPLDGWSDVNPNL